MLVNSKFIIYNQVVMSIPNIIDKIKSKFDIDKITIMYLFIIVGVGISSFGLGKLSVVSNSNKDDNSLIAKREDSIVNNNIDIGSTPATTKSTDKKMYVASKNGKMYYTVGCSGVKRIKLENQVWFNSKIDAEKSGYTLSSACK